MSHGVAARSIRLAERACSLPRQDGELCPALRAGQGLLPAAAQRAPLATAGMCGSKRRSMRHCCASLAACPSRSRRRGPARYAAPERGRLRDHAAARPGTPSRSAWNCSSRSLRRRRRPRAARSARCRRPPASQSAGRPTWNAMPSSAARATWPAVVPRVSPSRCAARIGDPSAAPRGRRTRARDTRRRCRARSAASASISPDERIRPRPSRSHCTTAPPMNTLPSSA